MAVTPQTNTSLERIAEAIAERDNFVLCGHVSPDGDCLGSQLSLWHTLKALGKTATCVLVRDEPIPHSLAFMPGADDMVYAGDFDGPCDVFVALDVPTRARIGKASCAILDRAGFSITIDHHSSETTMSDLVYVDPDCAAASMPVWQVAKLLLDEPPVESATCAYVGLVTDTGGFRFQNSDCAAFNMAAEFVAYGVNPSYVATNVYQCRSMPSLKLESLTIDRMEPICGGDAIVSWIKEEDLRAVGAVKADVEPLIDTLRSVQGARIACLLREQDGKIRGNIRSKDDTDVSVLARRFDGGGHKAAAGFIFDGSIEEALVVVGSAIADHLSC